ncbi:hypothetical protein FRX31_021824 [Thalictrum thalictroides]|uniref:RNase H type-1 domain-containing protein n=1 Tax=Thalictrum thalictroides TaxID=46969 RepID=A0A7J6VU26_THATH|nr:hypothetical protein FRX31_021824 [Thalictrum thalictroides]
MSIEVIQKATHCWMEWQKSLKLQLQSNIVIVDDNMVLSDYECVYTDAAYDKRSNKYVVAVVLKCGNNDIIATVYRRGRASSVAEAELIGILVGLKLAKQKSIAKVQIIGDCQKVLQSLKEENRIDIHDSCGPWKPSNLVNRVEVDGLNWKVDWVELDNGLAAELVDYDEGYRRN